MCLHVVQTPPQMADGATLAGSTASLAPSSPSSPPPLPPLSGPTLRHVCQSVASRFTLPLQWLHGHWAAIVRRSGLGTPPPKWPLAARPPQTAAVSSFRTVHQWVCREHQPGAPWALLLDIDYTVLADAGQGVHCAPPACHQALLRLVAEAPLVAFITARPGPDQGCPENVEATLRDLRAVHILADPSHVVFVGHVHKGPAVAAWLQRHAPPGTHALFVDDNVDCIASVAQAAPSVQTLLFCGELATPALHVCAVPVTLPALTSCMS